VRSAELADAHPTLSPTLHPGPLAQVYFPLALRFVPVDDDRPEFSSTGAMLYGPLLLAGE
jgi:hypothetical protein